MAKELYLTDEAFPEDRLQLERVNAYAQFTAHHNKTFIQINMNLQQSKQILVWMYGHVKRLEAERRQYQDES